MPIPDPKDAEGDAKKTQNDSKMSKTKPISIRIGNAEDRSMIEAAATLDGLSVMNYVRSAAIKAARDRVEAAKAKLTKT